MTLKTDLGVLKHELQKHKCCFKVMQDCEENVNICRLTISDHFLHFLHLTLFILASNQTYNFRTLNV